MGFSLKLESARNAVEIASLVTQPIEPLAYHAIQTLSCQQQTPVLAAIPTV